MEGEEGKPSLLRLVEEREREGQRGVVAGKEGEERRGQSRGVKVWTFSGDLVRQGRG